MAKCPNMELRGLACTTPQTVLSSSICESSVNNVGEVETWMTPIIKYLESRELPSDKVEAWALRMKDDLRLQIRAVIQTGVL